MISTVFFIIILHMVNKKLVGIVFRHLLLSRQVALSSIPTGAGRNKPIFPRKKCVVRNLHESDRE